MPSNSTTKTKTAALRATDSTRNTLKSVAALLGKSLFDATEEAIAEYVRRRRPSAAPGRVPRTNRS